MSWPSSADYNEAIQNLATSAGDDELRAGAPEADRFGRPMPYAGNFADVYRVDCPGTGNSWAVKCFTREVTDLRDRYRAISEHLEQVRLPFMTEFRYLDQGVRINGSWYPLVKMRWVEGVGLNRFVSENLDKPKLLGQLGELWLRMAARLEEADMAHADLQHGNVLLVPVPESNSLRLTLIDYDGMYVPALTGRGSGERGHPAYQHPHRLRDGTHDATVDRFSHLAIFTALQCLAADATLWGKYDNRENLLFKQADFAKPGRSDLFRRLWETQTTPRLRGLVGRLILATQEPLDRTPRLGEFIRNGQTTSLTVDDERRAEAVLGIAAAVPVVKAAPPPPLPVSRPVAAAGAAPPPIPSPPSTNVRSRAWRLPLLVGGTVAAVVILGLFAFWMGRSSGPTLPLAQKMVEEGKLQLGPATPTSNPLLPEVESLPRRLDDDSQAVPIRTFRWLDELSSISLSPDGRQLLTASRDSANLWDVESGRLLTKYPGAAAPVAFNAAAEGRLFVSGPSRQDAAAKNSAIVWVAATGEKLHTLTGHDDDVTAVAVSPDGKTIATGSESRDGTVILWNATTGARLHRLYPRDGKTGKTQAVPSVDFSPVGGSLMVGGYNSITVWNVAGGTQTHMFASDGGGAATYSPDGKQYQHAVQGWPPSIDVCDATSGQVFRPLRTSHTSSPIKAAFSPDGRALLTHNGTEAFLYNAATGDRLRTFRKTGHSIVAAAFTPDGRRIVTAGRDKTAILWDTKLDELLATPSPSAPPPSAPISTSPISTSPIPAELTAATPTTIENTIGMKLNLIPAGEFLMGSPEDDLDATADEKPQHRVRITKPFYMGIYEVTQGQWQRVMGTTPWSGKFVSFVKGTTSRSGFGPTIGGRDAVVEGPEQPAHFILWDDAQAFCDKLSATEGKIYRLPTEAEWEYSCRAGTTTKYFTGDDAESLVGFANVRDTAFNAANPAVNYITLPGFAFNDGWKSTAPVGQFKPNPFGLYDMIGNVGEWCHDYFSPTYYGQAPADDPVAAAETIALRTVRGGSWSQTPNAIRSASRHGYSPKTRTAGFRIVLASTALPAPAVKVSATHVPSPTATASPPQTSTVPPTSTVNSIGMKLNLIPAGEFMMGANDAFPDERPVHRVRITKPFYIGQTEVTQGQWRTVMGTTPWRGQKHVVERLDHAASYITWDEAKEFCRRFSARERKMCNLPTEAQWEYACRAGTTTKFSFGDDEALLDDYAWWGGLYGNGNAKNEQYAHPVGTKRPNPWGLFDMHGNVWEWCDEWHDTNFYARSPTDDPANFAAATERPDRGGGWYNPITDLRSGRRGNITPGTRRSNVGFRIVVEP